MATFTNQATLTYTGGTANSNIVTGELLDAITVSKTPITNSYGTGDIITYTVSLINGSATNYTGLTVTDNLGAYTFNGTTLYPLTYQENAIQYYVNGVLQPQPADVSAGPPLTITGISVPAGGNAQIIYSVSTNEFAPLGTSGSISNTVSVTGNGIVDAATATALINTLDEADLSIIKAIDPVSFNPGDTVTYTFTIQNSGDTPATEQDDIIITDTFNPPLTLTSVTYGTTVWQPTTNYVYDAATGVFSTNEGQITVPAATYTQDPTTGEYLTTPGTATLTVVGTIG